MDNNEKKPRIGNFWISIIAFILFLIVLYFLVFRPAFNSSANNNTPSICMTISPSYLMDCMVNGTHIQAQATPENYKSAESKYGCTINTTYTDYNILNCSTPSNYTKYKIPLNIYP